MLNVVRIGTRPSRTISRLIANRANGGIVPPRIKFNRSDASAIAEAQQRTDFGPKNGLIRQCAMIEVLNDIVTFTFNTGPLHRDKCPTADDAGNLLALQKMYTMTRRASAVDYCAQASASTAAGIIDSKDMCLAKWNQNSRSWNCVLKRPERVANPVWNDKAGGATGFAVRTLANFVASYGEK